MDHDFISIHFTGFPTNNLQETLVFTSANAVTAFTSHRGTSRHHKAYCLEGETMQSLSKLANIQIVGVSANALSLAKKIAADNDGVKLSFICGHQRRNELPDYLRCHGVNVDEIKVYETRHAGFPIVKPYDGVLFFSPSGVESFFQTNILSPGIPCFTIGETTALATKEYTGNLIITATQSTQEDLLKTVTRFFNKNLVKRNANH